MLRVDRENGGVVLLGQIAYQLACHDQGLLVGEAYLLAALDGVDGGGEPGKSYHRGEYHVYGLGFYYLVEGVAAGIDLDVGLVVEQRAEFTVFVLVGYDHGSRVELPGLLSQLHHAVVGREAVDFVEVGMLFDDIQRLGTYRARTAKYADLFLHYYIIYP